MPEETRTSRRTAGVLWWIAAAVTIGAAAALVGASLELAPVYVAIAAGILGAVLPAYFDGRLRRRRLRATEDR